MKIYRCMHDIEAICNEHGRQLLLIWFINYLPLTKFHIVNPMWAISTLIITSCCTCHNYICNLFLNGILAGASVSYGYFSSLNKWFCLPTVKSYEKNRNPALFDRKSGVTTGYPALWLDAVLRV